MCLSNKNFDVYNKVAKFNAKFLQNTKRLLEVFMHYCL